MFMQASRLWDLLVFRKVARRLGGRLRFILSGSATLSANVSPSCCALTTCLVTDNAACEHPGTAVRGPRELLGCQEQHALDALNVSHVGLDGTVSGSAALSCDASSASFSAHDRPSKFMMPGMVHGCQAQHALDALAAPDVSHVRAHQIGKLGVTLSG